MSDPRIIVMECLRYHPERDAEPYHQRFEVPFTPEMSVLEGLQYIKDHLDGSLTFRWSCRMAVCGNCGCMVNGEPVLSCQTFLRDYHPGCVRVEPLDHFPIQRDLAVDPADFLDKLQQVAPYLIPAQDRTPEDGPYRQTPEQMQDYLDTSACINCLLCYAACPQYGLKADFLGPAALALAHRYNADSRDAGRARRMEVMNGDAGVWGCTLVGRCSEVCPKGVDPAAAINRNKPAAALDTLRRLLRSGRTCTP